MTTLLDSSLLGLPEDRTPAPPKLRIAVQHDSPFKPSIEAAGFEAVLLPPLSDTHFNRSLPQRVEDGRAWQDVFKREHIDLLFDLETSAMTFAADNAAQPNSITLTNALHGLPYVAHYIDPITETMQKIDWPTRWQLLEHRGWTKWIWDEAHAEELVRLGASNILSMPMAAMDGSYSTDPLPETPSGPAVCFLGHPATSWFTSSNATPASMRTGLIAAAAAADYPGLKFHQIYYDLYGVDQPPGSCDAPQERARKAAAYFQAKFMYNVYLAVKQRDRFVLFLKHKLGTQFELIGDFWSKCLGVTHKPALRGQNNLTSLFRGAAININLYKGNCETGLNQRQFEVTAAGGFLLTYKSPELSRHFVIGKECAVFENERDLLEKVRHYLAHPRERVEMAAAGQRRTLDRHLYSHRLRQLVNRVCSLAKPATTARSAPLT